MAKPRTAGPDWELLKEIAAEAAKLARPDGSLPRDDYDRLLAAARDAAAGDDDLVEFIENREPI